MEMKILWVGIGGGLGAILRYAVSCIPYKGTFPVLTFITNVTGAVLIGLLVGIAARKNLSENVMLLLKTGVCGGYTTFSTFSLEAYQLITEGHQTIGTIYAVLSTTACIGGVWFGIFLAGLGDRG